MSWPPPPSNLSDHVVICNASVQVRRIVRELHAELVAERPDVVLVLQDDKLWREQSDWRPDAQNEFTRDHFFVLAGRDLAADRAVLDDVCIDSARMAVILADPIHGLRADARSLLLALAIEQRNRRVHTVLELLSSPNRIHLRGTAIDEVVCVDQLTEKLIAQCCITPGVGQVFRSLLVNTPDTNNIHLVPVPEPLGGLSYRAVCRRAVTQRLPFIPIGFVQKEAADGREIAPEGVPIGSAEASDPVLRATFDPRFRRTFVLNPRRGADPGRETTLRAGDALIAIAFRTPDLASLVEQEEQR